MNKSMQRNEKENGDIWVHAGLPGWGKHAKQLVEEKGERISDCKTLLQIRELYPIWPPATYCWEILFGLQSVSRAFSVYEYVIQLRP